MWYIVHDILQLSYNIIHWFHTIHYIPYSYRGVPSSSSAPFVLFIAHSLYQLQDSVFMTATLYINFLASMTIL
jgi:hypothetical protein